MNRSGSTAMRRLGFALLSAQAMVVFGDATASKAYESKQYIHKIAAFDGSDARQTFEDYAKFHGENLPELNAKFSATGGIYCGKERASANVIGRMDVIVTVNHILCNARVEAKACTFKYSATGREPTAGEHSVQVAQLLTAGQQCDERPDSSLDWAVLKLTAPATGLKPYRVDPDFVNSQAPGTKLIFISDFSNDFCETKGNGACMREAGSNDFLLPRTIQDCELKQIEASANSPGPYATNCASSAGASGGAVLSSASPQTLLAIHVSDMLSKDEVSQETAEGRPIVRPFSMEAATRWFSKELPVSGDFAAAIRKAVDAPARHSSLPSP